MSRRAPWAPAAALLIAVAVAGRAEAHSLQASLLEVQLEGEGVFLLRWAAAPGSAGLLPLTPPGCRVQGPVPDPAPTMRGELSLSCPPGASLRVAGAGVGGDLLVRVRDPAGKLEATVLRGADDELPLGRPPPRAAWFRLGLHHVALGWDHLAFLAVLVAGVRRLRPLFFVVSGFTLAHALSLGAVVGLGLRVPSPPVEAWIALSIVLLAAELARRPHRPLARPGRLALGFGLVHGLGFASALVESGLPEAGAASALLRFHLGVEALQLAWVALLAGIFAGSGAAAPRVAGATAAIAGMLGAAALWARLAQLAG